MDSGQKGDLQADAWYPYGFAEELKAMYSLAWPTVCAHWNVSFFSYSKILHLAFTCNVIHRRKTPCLCFIFLSRIIR